MITYEYPLNERIRTLLRLEDLFERSRHFIARTDPLDHAAIPVDAVDRSAARQTA